MTDLDQAKTDAKITRRTVAKGAAWTLPVVSLAAAAPTASASPVNPCTDCLSANSVEAVQAVDLLGSTVAFASGDHPIVNACAGTLGFLAIVGPPLTQHATATLSDGTTVTSTFGVFGGGEADFAGQSVAALAGTLRFPTKKNITKICSPFSVFYAQLGGSAPINECSTTLCWNVVDA